MPSLRKVKQQAKVFYDAWRKTGSFCPAFNSEIVVSLKGWRHITGATGSKKRKRDDAYRRLMLLPYAKQITERSTTVQNVAIKHKIEYHVLEAMVAVKEGGKTSTSKRKVRVVFVKDKAGKLIFYSVMDKKTR
jgi:hypothetical protein